MFMVLRTLLVSVCLFNSALVTGKYSYVCVNEGACHLSLLLKKKLKCQKTFLGYVLHENRR